MRTAAVLLVLALLALPSTADATRAANGKFLNGKFLNGKFLNTAVMDGSAIGGEAGFVASLPGWYTSNVHVDNNGFAGWAWSWATWSWQWQEDQFWIGLELAGKHANPDGSAAKVKRLKVDSIVPAEPGSDVLLHYVSVFEDNVWQPLCGRYENQQLVPALVLRGEWSEEAGAEWGGDQISDDAFRVTFACATGALGKCAAQCYAGDGKCPEIPIDLGYRRWAHPEWVYVPSTKYTGPTYYWRDYVLDHQACTRMVRADYCGDGRPMTTDGTQIDVYDRSILNWMTETPGSTSWDYEATWNEDGAVQVSCKRDGGYIINCTPPYQLYNSAYNLPVMCYGNHGMSDPARIANLRRKALIFISPF